MLDKSTCFLWTDSSLYPLKIELKEEPLIAIDHQVKLVFLNISSFIKEGIYLNMLLWGEKGSGKSSLIKNMLAKFYNEGLRVVQFVDSNITSLYKLYEAISDAEYKFLLLFDDISFDADNEGYRRFKSILEGGLLLQPKNVLVVATSNRRHLIQERVLDTEDIYSRDDQNEAISLFSRFGLTVGFYPFSREDYLKIVKHYFVMFQIPFWDNWEKDAESFAIHKGGRNGRTAKQFATYIKIFGSLDTL
ncbi:MAG: ATP-binding protein [Calditerrivibrio sp.]|nr:ATP-binding protein [Calditerrivibrio sp.]